MDQGEEEVRGYSHKSWVVVCRPLSKTPTPLMTKIRSPLWSPANIFDFPYPIYDIIKIRYPIFDGCVSVAGTVALNVSYYELSLMFLLIMTKKELPLRNIVTQFKTRVLKPYPIQH